MTTATKTNIAIVTITSETAKQWIEDNASVRWIDRDSFALPHTFLEELLEAMTDDDLTEGVDFDIVSEK
jgi:hypothetical protein